MNVLTVISLGAGVQSTTLALMAAHGEISPMPDYAIFADTGDEPEAVYDHLNWLSSSNVLPFPVVNVTEGKLSEELFNGNDLARVPFFVGKGGISNRQCTRNFKIRPVRRQIRKLLGVSPRGYVAPASVSQWIGISTDEAMRVKPSGAAYIENRHPLIELRMSRGDCIQWLHRHGYQIPPKSACIYCPYQSNAQWREKDKNSMAQAIEVDRQLRTPKNIERFRGELYVHPSRKPLDQVDFSTAEDRGQLNMFLHECEGMCGN